MSRCGPLKFICEGSDHIPHAEVGMISDTNKIPPILTPEVIEGDVQDDKDDEKVQSKFAHLDLSESNPNQIEIDPEETFQKVDLTGTTALD